MFIAVLAEKEPSVHNAPINPACSSNLVIHLLLLVGWFPLMIALCPAAKIPDVRNLQELPKAVKVFVLS